ncbi:MAG TPA: MBL fold metallo-hydrolase [Gemmatimonadaceae bacterium]|nr:MBL fold metallo-hydrolase [Gemmatimonadaceae bacterium]
MFERKIALLIALSLASVRVAAQPDPSQVTIKITPLAAGVYMLQGSGGNIAISVGNDDVFMIDDQYAPLTPKIKAAIATITPKPVRFLLNTHWHGDHTGGNENMAGSGAIIVAQDNTRTRMSKEQFIAAFNQKVPPSPAAALPIVTFSESLSLFLNGDSVRAVHVKNAHTDGDVIVTFPAANVMHMGDTFFNGMYPLVDVSTGGSIDGIIAAVDKALAITNANTKYIPGHGSLGTRADLVAYQNMTKTIRSRVAGLISQKKTLDQIVAAKPTADFDAKWGGGFLKPEVFVGILYADLSRKPSR